MLHVPENIQEPIEAITRFRYAVLGRASGILEQKQPATHEDGSLREVTGLLATTLEELKVAEEELRAQNTALLSQRAASELQLRRYRDLFLHSPAPTIITDLHGTILEVNVAASRLIRRRADLMTRKPLVALVAQGGRDEFRRKLSRVPTEGTPRDWRLSLSRGDDVPVDVCATVQRIVGEAAGGPHSLCWLFSAPKESGEHVWDFDSSAEG